MKILVTGGAGYLGTAIVAALSRRGHTPVIFSRRPVPGSAVDVVIGDVTDRASLTRAARGVDAICHSAALVTIWERDRRRFDAVNVGGLQNAIVAARAAGHDRFVYTSSFLALPPAGAAAPARGNDYQRTKTAARVIAEDAARSGFPITRIYPGVIYGPSSGGDGRESNLVGRLVREQIARRSPGIVGGDRLWSFAWIDDVADGHAAAFERVGGPAEFSVGGENLPQRRLFEIVEAETGAPVPRSLPAWAVSIAGAIELARAYATGRPPVVTPATLEIFRHDWPLDSSAAIAELNYKVTPLVTGLRTLLAKM
jgi:farnesol dehydrogenase